ncbi:hypothetical protein FACS1894147_00500 [Spirochaetia bacterium]|nr:hypothetical protein FACS1894147_00500 [Spirochaetia bacterium]
MITVKRFAVFSLFFIAGLSFVTGQQTSGGGREMSVEESYLQESVEMMVIREQSHVATRESKLIALEYIGGLIQDGKAGKEIEEVLEYMSLEGILNKSRENGRLINNFPDVRVKAVVYLGELGTPEAKDALLKVMVAENEPMVLIEAIKGLGKIGLNDNEETASCIAFIVSRFDVLNPDNLVALAALDAFEKLADKNGGIKDPQTLRIIMKIGEGRYIKPVQDKAKSLLAAFRNKYTAQSK